eukprot:983789-Pleurochrysis_carterae.AAC.1
MSIDAAALLHRNATVALVMADKLKHAFARSCCDVSTHACRRMSPLCNCHLLCTPQSVVRVPAQPARTRVFSAPARRAVIAARHMFTAFRIVAAAHAFVHTEVLANVFHVSVATFAS